MARSRAWSGRFRRRFAAAHPRSPCSSETGRSASRRDGPRCCGRGHTSARRPRSARTRCRAGRAAGRAPDAGSARDIACRKFRSPPCRAPTMSSTSSPSSGWNRLLPSAEHHQIVFVARLIERAEGQMMHVGFARQQRIDHVVAEPVAETCRRRVGDHRDAAGRDRLEPLGRRQPHQHLRRRRSARCIRCGSRSGRTAARDRRS